MSHDVGLSTPTPRDQALNEAFVSLADTLVGDFDLIDLLDRLVGTCVRVLGADAAGLLLSDQRDGLRVLASSTEQMRLLELFQLQNNEGPCLDSFRTARPVGPVDLADTGRWPRFAAAAREAGFVTVVALPLRLRRETIGALNMLYAGPGGGVPGDVGAAQALADVATIAILQHRAMVRADTLTTQLQAALNSRLVIEQAKGLLAERGGIGISDAFDVLRRYCRGRRLALSVTARRLVSGEIDADDVLAERWPGSPGIEL